MTKDFREQADEIVADIEEEVSGVARRKRQAFKDRHYPNTTWANGVSYFFDPNASKSLSITIRVFVENGCWSYVGRLGKQQDLSLGEGCESVGTAAHELGHALGFYHTMSRHDRDQYFTKQTTNTNENYGLGYDCGSIMHYSAYSASYNNKPTLVPMDENYLETLGSRFIAFYDLWMLNKHYGCLDKCDKDPQAAKCENGGIPHPRDCTRCLCPNGYAGTLCDKRVSDLTSAFSQNSWAGANKKSEVIRIQPESPKCGATLQSPKNTQIEVRIDGISGTYASGGCPFGGVEIKAQEDQRSTGYR
ncbi:unnamed protein product [Heligmosomoides polygyrus]|uniref:Metalloendopeptidase n=1 Tax=Heligmosomoides polygyrus TaxID=6339 RepID=A0A3P8EPT9_HELPZ|nr:unnamed protein product [Heligmosomoides polygyrus]